MSLPIQALQSSTMPIMAREIENFEAIDQLQHLNGIPIAGIERRARPGVYAQTGFLGKNESLKEVLKADWQTVSSLGTTHIALATELRSIWNQLSYGESKTILYHSTSSRTLLKRAPLHLALLISLVTGVAALIFFKPFILFGLTLAIPFAYLACRNFQVLKITQFAHRGMQSCIFGHRPENPEIEGWHRQLMITNRCNGKSLLIGEGVINYIEKYGFYEGGGDQNPYRVDPARLAAIL